MVIGILIALSINNANDERKDGIELKNYLLKISNDVNRDIKQIEILKIRRDTVRSKAIHAINRLINMDYSDMEVIVNGGAVFREFYFIPNKSGFEAIKTSPYLGKINNTKLDSLLTDYYAMVDYIQDREQGVNEFIETMEAEFVSSTDRFPNHTIRMVDKFPGLLEVDTSDVNWKNKLYDEMTPVIENYSFRAALVRAVGYVDYTRQYEELVKTGKILVDEITMITQ